jgi:hypothetical protein
MATRGKQTLVQRIALDGGKAIKRELEELGAEGKAAFEALRKAADDVSKAGSGLNRFLTNARREFKQLGDGVGEVGRGLSQMSDAARSTAIRFTALTAAVGATGFALFKLTEEATKFADAQGKAAQRVGLAIKEYGRLQFAFEQGDVEAAAFETGIKKLSTTLTAAADGTGKEADLFRDLGVAVKDANGDIRPLEGILLDIANVFNKMPDGVRKTALAVELFGRSGLSFIPTLNEGRDAVRGLGDDAERLGFVLSDQQTADADRFGDSLNQLNRTITGLRTSIGLLFAVPFAEFFDSLTVIVDQNRDTLLNFGKAFADSVIPLFQDFLALMSGNESAVANKGLLAIRDTIVNLASAFNTLHTIVSVIFDILVATVQPILDVFNAIFGTNIRADVAFFVAVLAQFLGVFRLIGAAVKGSFAIFNGLKLIFGTVTAQIAAFTAAGFLMAGTLRTAVDAVISAFADLLAPIGELINGVVEATRAVLVFFGFISDAAPGAVGDVNAVNSAIARTKGELAAVEGSVADEKFTSIAEGSDKVATSLDEAGAASGSFFPGFQDDVEETDVLVKKATSTIEQYAAAIASLSSSSGGAPSESGEVPALAGGGRVRGAGTGTSDSILARLSNGEFVVRAAAVRRYGTRFLAAINSGRLPKFAFGGIVSGLTGVGSPMPAFAGGGAVSMDAAGAISGRPINLTMPSGETFEMVADEVVAQKIVRFATNRSVRRGGKTPSWYRG